MKPFRTNALVLFCQEKSRHQPERKKILRSYVEYNMWKGKCDVVTVITDFLPFFRLFVPMTEPNT